VEALRARDPPAVSDNAPMRRPGSATPTFATGWVADRLGISTATLRTWHSRYGLAPTARTTGGHRRYSEVDLARLEAMHRLIDSGVPAAEAARLSHADSPGRPGRRATGPRRRGRRDVAPGAVRGQRAAVRRAAMALDGAGLDAVLADALRAHGVVRTWTAILVPVLQVVGEGFATDAGCIAAEHVLTERTQAALAAAARRYARVVVDPPILLAAVEGDQHVLPLHALAAALAESRRSSVLLGSVPPASLAAAVATVAPAGVFVWAQLATDDVDAPLAAAGPRAVVGGRGWARRAPPAHAVPVGTLADAVDALLGGSPPP
jgi:MerR family transcriptional regulator, light-induced transcriptional regulator